MSAGRGWVGGVVGGGCSDGVGGTGGRGRWAVLGVGRPGAVRGLEVSGWCGGVGGSGADWPSGGEWLRVEGCAVPAGGGRGGRWAGGGAGGWGGDWRCRRARRCDGGEESGWMGVGGGGSRPINKDNPYIPQGKLFHASAGCPLLKCTG